MATRVEIAGRFNKELRRLARKYPSVADEVDDLIADLEANDRPGSRLSGLGYRVFKVRLRNRSANRGLSGGFRVIYYEKSGALVLLLLIYSKTERADIPDSVIRGLINSVE